MGHVVEWKPNRIAAAKGGGGLFRSESLELRRGDKVRFTRNDPASGLTNGQVAAVESVGKDGFGFRLEDGSPMKLGEGDPQLRHLDRAWAATIHAFQGKTVDRIIAAMPSGNANLVNQKSLYVRSAGRATVRISSRTIRNGSPISWSAPRASGSRRSTRLGNRRFWRPGSKAS